MNEKKRINKNLISIMGGVCFVLLALVGIFSHGTPFEFIETGISTVFGFVGFWILLPYIMVIGFYLIFKKKLLKLKVGLSLWGVFIIIFSFLIFFSEKAATGFEFNGVYFDGHGYDGEVARFIKINNCAEVFEYLRSISSKSFGPSPKLGGGYVGFFVAGVLNDTVSPVGATIIAVILLIIGLALVLNREVKKLYTYLKVRKEHKSLLKEEKEDESDGFIDINAEVKKEEPILTEQANSDPFAQQTTESKPAIKPIYETFHTSSPVNNDYSLKKAHFNLSNEPVIEDSMVRKIEDVATISNEEIAKPVFESEAQVEESVHEYSSLEENATTIEENPVFKEQTNEFVESESIEETPIEEPVQEEVEVDPLFRPQPKANLIQNYIYPNLDLLDLRENSEDATKNESSCQQRIDLINQTLNDLRVGAQVVGYTVGPSVTRFDLQTNPNVSITAVQRYIQDISIRLNGASVRFEPIVSGKSTSGLEIPNEIRTNVGLRESIAGLPSGEKYLLSIPFGKNISGELIHANLGDFPHMLVSGTTGSGKSIFIHSTIITLIMRNKPDELKLVLIDPKKVEMNYYKGIPHLLCPNISDPRKALVCFNKLVDEMERRYNLFQMNDVRDMKGFNAFAKANNIQPLPYIVVFIDEFADLVDTCKEIREPVVRIAQKARAAGIHMVIATQRPSVNVIDGTIKGNIATRVALMSASAVDSQTIIGEGGAEKLLGYGDMLIDCSLISRSSKPRVQGCFVSETEITRVCEFLKTHYQQTFDENFLDLEPKVEEKKAKNEPAIEEIDKTKPEDEQYQDIKEQVMHREYCSISFIQRSFAMGFSRAGKIFNQLVKEGIVAPSGDSRGCKVLCYTPSEQQLGTIEQSTFIPDEELEN